jgi:hypothetical protein
MVRLESKGARGACNGSGLMEEQPARKACSDEVWKFRQNAVKVWETTAHGLAKVDKRKSRCKTKAGLS